MLENLLATVKRYNPDADLGLIERAYALAERSHKGQLRKSGEKYITHPMAVAEILAEIELDATTVASAILHDVVEDTEITIPEVAKLFGDDVAMLVDGVTKLKKVFLLKPEDQQAETIRKMLLAMAKDVRVILIKLADRLHNMRTLKHMLPEKQYRIAKETLEIYAPLAHRLGIFKIKWELEDLSLRYIDPEKYYELVAKIDKKLQEREAYIEDVIGMLEPELRTFEIYADIQGRPKHFYSIYNKMIKQGKEIGEIFDLIAVRIIVDSVKDCYAALGIVHTLWKPIPGRFKDYIAMPKTNLYQSLHTSVMGPDGEPFEIQIRTWEMHRISEYGIAAHWRYKEGSISNDDNIDEKFTWMRQILDLQRETRDAREYVDTIKTDIFSDRVYIFTPKGEVVELGVGATTIDFAYRIHTDIGHRCIGGKVNGKIEPLDYVLKNGDIVEIVTSKIAHPKLDWLNIVKSSHAKSCIKAWYKKEARADNLKNGKEMLDKEIKKQHMQLAGSEKELLEKTAPLLNFPQLDDLYVAIGDSRLSAVQVIAKLNELIEPKKEVDLEQAFESKWKEFGKPCQGVRVKGIDNILIRLSQCCTPIPGDEIVGYITRNRGVSVHRKDCSNIVSLTDDEKMRLIEVAWDMNTKAKYFIELVVEAIDRQGLAAEVFTAISETRASIHSLNLGQPKSGKVIFTMKVEISDEIHYNQIINRVKKIKDVLEVYRGTPKLKGEQNESCSTKS